MTPVLMYHAVTDADESAIPADELPYTVTKKSFIEQMSYLADNDIGTRVVNDDGETHAHTVVLTFDDGHETDYANVMPILLARAQRAEIYITTGRIGQDRYMTASQIREIDNAGMVVGSHGITHQYFNELDALELRRELHDSKAKLEDIVGHRVDCGSAPGGRLHADVRRTASDLGYRYLCTSKVGLAKLPLDDDFQLLPRLVIGRTMNLDTFAKVVSGNRKELLLRQARTQVLGLMKTMLGNARYDRMRGRVLGNSD